LKEIRDYALQRSDPRGVGGYIETWEDYFFGESMEGENLANWCLTIKRRAMLTFSVALAVTTFVDIMAETSSQQSRC
jgi:hypothetical protein